MAEKDDFCMLFSSFRIKSNISCFLFFDFGAQGLHGHDRGRGRLRSSGSHVARKKGKSKKKKGVEIVHSDKIGSSA